MTWWTRPLLGLVERCAPEGIGASIAGDLEEEARDSGDLWLARQALFACWHGVRMKARSWNPLETAAATALLFAMPLTLLLAVRRFALTLIPYRDSAGFGVAGLVALCGAIALLAAAQTWLLAGVPVARLVIPQALSVVLLPVLFAIPMPPVERAALLAAVCLGAFPARWPRPGRKS